MPHMWTTEMFAATCIIDSMLVTETALMTCHQHVCSQKFVLTYVTYDLSVLETVVS